MAITHATPADGNFTPKGKTAWEEAHTGSETFTPTGTGAVERTAQTAAQAIVRSGDYTTIANYNTAQAALTESIGVKDVRIGTGVDVGITFPSQGAAPFYMAVGGATFNGQFDPAIGWGYNAARAVSTEPSLGFNMEGHYFDGANHYCEHNFDYVSSDGLTSKRFLAFNVNRLTHVAQWAKSCSIFRVESDSNVGEWTFTTSTGNLARSVADGSVSTLATVKDALTLANASTGVNGTFSPAIAFNIGGTAGVAKIFTTRLGGSGGVLHFATDTTSGALTDRWKINEAGHWLCVSSNSYDVGASGTEARTGYFKTSVITPLVNSGGSGNIVLGSTSVATNDAVNVMTGYTNTVLKSNRVLRLASNAAGADCSINFTDTSLNGWISMMSGELYLGSNGGTQLKIVERSSSNDYITVTGGVNGTNTPTLSVDGQTNISLVIVGKGTGVPLLSASTSTRSSMRIPHGSAPASPVDGDMWTTSTGFFVRINGGTVGPLT